MNDIPDYYQVKFRTQGAKRWKYGILDRFGGEAQTRWMMGKVAINDAVLPKTWVVDYATTEIVSIPLSRFPDKNEYDKYIDKEHEKAKAKAEKSTTLLHRFFYVGIADGVVPYVITKVNKKTVRVEWRGFDNLDRYVCPVLGWEGVMNRGHAERMV